MACAARLGRTHWEVLLREEELSTAPVCLNWESIGTAIDILTMLASKPRRMVIRGVEDMAAMAQLWRHRGHPQSVVLHQPGQYPWLKTLTTPDGLRYEWPETHGSG